MAALVEASVQLLIRISSQSPYWLFASVVFNTIQSSAASIWQFVIRNSTLLYTVYMYQQSFEFYNTGYGAALAWVMLLLIGLITLFLFATKKFWVYEGGV